MSITFKEAGACALISAMSVAALAQSTARAALPEVVVSANGFADDSQSLPFGVSVLTQQDIERAGASSVSDALIRLLGLTGRLDTSGGGGHQIDLRGFGQTSDSNQVVVVDGRRLNVQDTTGSHLDDIAIESVQRIEVIRGSASVLFGEGATGGVIVITTKPGMGLERKNSATLSATVGSNGLRSERINATMVQGGFSVDVFGSDQKSDGHRDNFASVNNALGATAQWSNDWLRLGAQSSRNQLFSGLPGSLTEAQFAVNPRQADTPNDFGKLTNEVTNVFLEGIVGPWQLSVTVGERSRVTYAKYVKFNYEAASQMKDSTGALRARHEFKGTQFNNALTLGLESDQWSSVGWPVGSVESAAYYVNNDFTFNASKTLLSLGLRNDHIKKAKSSADLVDETQPAWHVGVSQPVLPRLTAFGRTGQSYRLANMDEIPTSGPMLHTQTSRDWELGLRGNYSQGHAELRWYRHQLTNEIGLDQALNNVNFDPTQRQGIELEAQHKWSATLASRVNLAVRESKFVDGPNAGKDIALAPKQTLSVGMNWEPMAQHRIVGDVQWVAAQIPGAGMTNDCSMPAYSTINARYAYAMRSAEFAVGVSNLADAKYYAQAYGCAAGVTSGIYPDPGRSLSASVKLKF